MSNNKKGYKANNCHEYLGNNTYMKDKKVYIFKNDGTFTITNSNDFNVSTNINNLPNVPKGKYKAHNYQYKNISDNNVDYEKSIPIKNYTSHPYQDKNIYDNDTDYTQEFYHNFYLIGNSQPQCSCCLKNILFDTH